MDRVIRDGKVAVLYSPGYGAGWSTWAHNKPDPQMLFDPHLVELVERLRKIPADWSGSWRLTLDARQLIDDIETYCEQEWPDEYLGGVKDLAIAWVPQGEYFRIHEYDGSESVEIRDQMAWIQACKPAETLLYYSRK